MALQGTSIRFAVYDKLAPADNGAGALKRAYRSVFATAKYSVAPLTGLGFAALDYFTSLTPNILETRPGTIIFGLIGLGLALGTELLVGLDYRSGKIKSTASAAQVAVLHAEIDQKDQLIKLQQAQLTEVGERRTEETGMPFDVVEEMAKGTQGRVYKTRDHISGKLGVLKLPDLITAINVYGKQLPRFLSYYKKEAENLGRVDHENVVKTTPHRKISLDQYERLTHQPVDREALRTLVGEKYYKELLEDVPHLEMELLIGESLGTTLEKARGYLDLNEVFDWMMQLACALAELKELNIVHRDIKPDNLFLTKQINKVKGIVSKLVKIVDFGIAKDVIGSGTTLGTVMGSPGYMSPEQIKGVPATWESDVFALGAVMWTLVTGEVLDQNPENLADFLSLPVPDLAEILRINSVRKGVIHPLVWNIDKYAEMANIDPKERETYREQAKQIQRQLIGAMQEIFNKTLALNPKERYQLTTAHDSKMQKIPVSAHEQLVADLTRLTQLFATYKQYLDYFVGNMGHIIPTTPEPTQVESLGVNISGSKV